MSATTILQPSCSPKKLTLLPTTGPRSRSTGDSRAVRLVRNLRRAFVAKTGSSADTDGLDGTSDSVRRGARRSRRPTARSILNGQLRLDRITGSKTGDRVEMRELQQESSHAPTR